MVAKLSTLAISILAGLCLTTAAVRADDPAGESAVKGIEFFEARIRPVLVEHCYKCHSADEKSESGLRLDSRTGIREGGDRGAAIVPGNVDASILLKAISHTDPDLKMPPKKERLSDTVIADFRAWIKMGAPDPRDGVTVKKGRSVDIAAGRKFWSFQPPTTYPVPSTRNPAWAKRKLDHFVLAKLEAANLPATADAEPSTLLRRVHFDLVGLPPSTERLTEFSKRIDADGIDAALAAEVDELLSSKFYGERWGRHWLDVARFAESSGKEANISFPYAWRYRDYVIDAFNRDIPYDRFLTEQIAGDLLPFEDDAERARLLIATGYLAVGPKNLDEANAEQFAADVLDEQIDSLTRGVMANSVACSRCHDHKFDPYAMQDYYALVGIFQSTRTFFGTFVTPSNRIGGDPLVLPSRAHQTIFHQSVPAERVASLKAELATLKKQQEEGMAAAMKAIQNDEDPEKSFSLREALRIFWTSGGIEGQLEKVGVNGEALPLAMGVVDLDRPSDARFLERGEIERKGNPVPRGFPRVISLATSEPIPANQSGRLELARWLTRPEHPLTARVITNRVWSHLFDRGIVSTVDDFGAGGEKPSHPELLDDLATQFVAHGWSIKKLVREIVLSRTYRQASTYDPSAFNIDPENRLLWRASKRRLDAEAIRDAMLSVSGELNSSRPLGSLVAKAIGDRPISLIGLDPNLPPDLDGSTHRSVYLPVLRDRLPEVLDLFDFAEPSLVTGDRETTNVPLQALYLMNSPFVQARSRALAERLLRDAPDSATRVPLVFRLCFSRLPDSQELSLANDYLQQLNGDEKQAWVTFCQGLLSTAEFRNLD